MGNEENPLSAMIAKSVEFLFRDLGKTLKQGINALADIYWLESTVISAITHTKFNPKQLLAIIASI